MPTKRSKKAARPDEIKFDYIKSNFYRVVHVDGATGGLTPTGLIHFNLWSQRRAIPKQVAHAIDGDQLGTEIRRDIRDAVVREVEVGAVMDVSTAAALRDWLDRQIAAFAEHVAAAQEEEATNETRPESK